MTKFLAGIKTKVFSLLSRAVNLAAFLILMPSLLIAANNASFRLRVICDPYPPAAITNLSASTGSDLGEVELLWTVPGDDGTEGQLQAGSYLIRYDTRPLSAFAGNTTNWWDNAAHIYSNFGWIPNSPGTIDTKTIADLEQGVTYFFAIRVKDKANQWSAISNVASARAGWDITWPDLVTTFVAETGSVEGEVKLSWLSPGDDGTVGQVVSGEWRVDYSTYNKEWNVSEYRIKISTSFQPLTTHNLLLTGLTGGVTHYFRIWTADEIPNWSPVSNGATAYAQVDVTEPAAVTDLAAQDGYNEIQLRWTAPGDDGAVGNILDGAFEIRYSSFATLSPYRLITLSTSCGAGTVSYYSVTGLTGDTSYYFAIRVADERGNWSPLSNTATGWTLDNVPPEASTSLVAIAGDTEVQLVWTASVSDDVAGYRIYRSTNLSTYQLVNLSTYTAYTDTGLTNLVTYWYFVKAVDLAGNESSSSTIVGAMPFSPDKIAPAPPVGIYTAFDNNRSVFSVFWSTVVVNEDGSVCDDLCEYRIYRSTSVYGPFVRSSATTGCHFTIPCSTDEVCYYAITACDDTEPQHNESAMSMIFDDTEERNLWIVGDEALVRIPAVASGILRSASNSFNDDIDIEATRNSAEETYPAGRIIRSFDFEAKKNISKEKVNFAFTNERIEISIFYKVSQGGTIQSLDVRENEAKNSLALVWFNGIEWVKIGGEVDTQSKCVKVLTRHLGKYQLRASKRAGSFEVMPGPIPKIFTPNSDGLNDIAMWTFDNPNEYAPSGEIFDLRGRKIADMKIGSDLSGKSGTLEWDGKTSGGKWSAPGVYIWQIKAGGNVYNGTVVVAR